MDTTEIGTVAAKVMSDVEEMYGDDARVVCAMTVYEVRFTDEDGDKASAVGLRVTDDSNVLALGLNARAYCALTDPDDD